jgi:hypothetical protein
MRSISHAGILCDGTSLRGPFYDNRRTSACEDAEQQSKPHTMSLSKFLSARKHSRAFMTVDHDMPATTHGLRLANSVFHSPDGPCLPECGAWSSTHRTQHDARDKRMPGGLFPSLAKGTVENTLSVVRALHSPALVGLALSSHTSYDE